MKVVYRVYLCDRCSNVYLDSKCTKCNRSNLKELPNEPIIVRFEPFSVERISDQVSKTF